MDNFKIENCTVCLLFYAETNTVEAMDSTFACDYRICVISNLCSCFSQQQKNNTNNKKKIQFRTKLNICSV